jgi:LacI family transcriptional regulator
MDDLTAGHKREGRGTLRDVAAHAGLSTTTVARVVHGNGYVSAKTRARVEAAMRDTGFRLNVLAQGLRRQRSMILGHILHGILPNPFFAEVAIGVEHAASEQGYNVLIFNTRGDPERERAGVETLLGRQVDGIIFTTALEARNVQLALDAGIPTVEVEKPLCDGAAAILVDNDIGATEAMNYLLDLGHRHIGYIGEPYTVLQGSADQRLDRVTMERFDAYRKAVEAAGVAFEESRLVLGDYTHDPGWTQLRTGRDYMQQLLNQAPDITAVFAGSDLLAAGALQALYERGIHVPTQMSVIGFDDTFAKHLAPPLTTVRQPTFEMGLRAGLLAIDLVSDRSLPSTVWCKTSLVVRDSTAAVSREIDTLSMAERGHRARYS